MTLIQLEYIVAVDNERHFGKAAERCFVTQPTLSMQIQKLEDALGVLIFDRNKHPIAPTAIGRQLLIQARVILDESRKIKELISDEKGEVSGTLRIGIIPTLSPYLLPLFIQSFMEKYPDVKLKVEELITEQVVSKLRHEQLDIGIIVTPYDDPALMTKPVFYEAFYAYVSEKSPLYKKGQLAVADISADEVWLLNEGHCFRDQVLNICKEYKERNSRFQYESGSLEALKKIVDRHDGVTLLPELATLDIVESNRHKLRRFIEPEPVREVSLVMRKSFLKRKLTEALHKEVLAAIPKELNIKKHGDIIKWK